MKRILPLTVLAFLIFTASAFAQFEIGASFELRDEEPQSGFGLRVEKGFLDVLPMINAGLRAHFSYFSEENQINPDNTPSYSEEFTNYDFGLAAYGGVSLGLMQPYIGVGLGSETTDIQVHYQTGEEVQGDDESNIFWNTFVGAKVTVVPFVKPFLEYRYSDKQLGDPRIADKTNGRIIVGISLSF